ncbi:MAG: glutamyl-tRNA reductase [Actinomycetota bacterium]
MSVLVVGVSHRSAPLPLLERITIDDEAMPKAITHLARRDTIREAVVLSTCNRTEVYVVAELFHGAYGDIRDFLCEQSGLHVDELAPHLYSQHDRAAVEHLYDVVAGLDSAVLGESEILGQVRGAWDAAQRSGGARSSLNLLFRSAVEAGKRVRTDTSIGHGTASVSHAAVEMIADVDGDLDERSVLVIGAGSMGDGVAVALARAGARHVVVANRARERADDLAARVGGEAIDFADIPTAIDDADIVVTGTGSGQPILTEALLEPTLRNRQRPLLIVDIAVPRDVEPAVAERSDVEILDLDDLRDWADRGLAQRSAETADVRRILAEEVDRFTLEATARQAAPLVASMHRAAERVRSAEFNRFDSRLADLDADQRALVEALTRSMVAKLLHEPSVRLKQQAGTPQGERNAAAVRDLFDL